MTNEASLLSFSDGVNSGTINIHVDKLGSFDEIVSRSIADVKAKELPDPTWSDSSLSYISSAKDFENTQLTDDGKQHMMIKVHLAAAKASHHMRVVDAIFWFVPFSVLTFLLTSVELNFLVQMNALLRMLILTVVVFITIFSGYLLQGQIFGKDCRERLTRLTMNILYREGEKRDMWMDGDEMEHMVREHWGI